MPTISTEADRLLAAVDPEWLEEASADVEATMQSRWGMTIRASTTFRSRGAGGWCDGMSITDAGIVVYNAIGGRRTRFTLAHELGHAIVEADDDCLMWLGDRDDVDRDLEQLCDVIAARILIPDWAVDGVLAGGPPSAAALSKLHAATEASWTACAIALASRLPCEGFVAIVNRVDNTVFFSARSRDTHPYAWAGDLIPASHELRRPEPRPKSKSFWPRFNVNEPRPYYLSIETTGDWAHAVFADNDLWSVERLHLPARGQEDRRHDGTISCPSCGYSGRTAMYPCSTCKQPTCQRCGKCGCDREPKRVMCKSCTLTFQAHLVVDGVCRDCRN